MAIVIYFIIDKYFDSSKVRHLKVKYSTMMHEVDLIKNKVDESAELLKELRYRDVNLYRNLLMIDPPKNVNDSVDYVTTHLSEEEQIADLKDKLDKLYDDMLDQQKSYIYLNRMTIENNEYLSSLPAILPVLKGFVTSGFGYRVHPIFKTRRLHAGIDIMTGKAEPIHATGDGIVAKVKFEDTSYGNQVVIDHSPKISDKRKKIKTRYAHMSRIVVKPNEKVKRGQVIGYTGKTGWATGIHVHYEVFEGIKQVDPVSYFIGNLSPKEYSDVIKRVSVDSMSMD